jgi:hypothetical protein
MSTARSSAACAGATQPSRSAQGRSNVYSQLSGLEDLVFNDFIKDDFLPEGDGQLLPIKNKSETYCWTLDQFTGAKDRVSW